MERSLRREINRGDIRLDDEGNIVRSGLKGGGKKVTTRGMIDRHGEQNLRDLLREQREAQRAYERGEPSGGKQRWENRDPSLPEWLYWYHGVFG